MILGVSVDEGIDDLKVASNLSRMRKRFHNLLDDTFSLFGSRRDSPVDNTRPIPIEVKSHSAINNRYNSCSRIIAKQEVDKEEALSTESNRINKRTIKQLLSEQPRMFTSRLAATLQKTFWFKLKNLNKKSGRSKVSNNKNISHV